MRSLLEFSIRSVCRRLIPVFLLVATLLVAPLAVAEEGTPGAGEQPPVLPGVPASVDVIAFSRVTLAAGDYQWQATSMPAFADDRAQIQTHRGFVVAVNNPVVILRADGTVWQASRGAALAVSEGERFAAVEVSGQAADMTIVEFPLVTDLLPNETPDQVAPVTLKQGNYILAVLSIPARKPGDPTPGQLLAKAAGPGIAVYPRAAGQATPTVADKNGPFWLVAIFPAPAETGTPGTTGSTSGGGSGADTGQNQGSTTGNGTGGGDGKTGNVILPTVAAKTPPVATKSPTVPAPPATTPVPTDLPPITIAPTPVPTILGGSSVIKEEGKLRVGDYQDDDGDGLLNYEETAAGTDPKRPDSDGDSLQDGAEVENGCNPLVKDTDGDGITDEGEALLFQTNCAAADTDGDGRDDYSEVFGAITSDAKIADTDGDGLLDFDEVMVYGTDPRVPDTDGDRLADGYEIYTSGTSPLLKDSDYDCLTDYHEIRWSEAYPDNIMDPLDKHSPGYIGQQECDGTYFEGAD